MRARVVLALIASIFTAGCDDSFCGFESDTPGIWMYVTDGATGAPLEGVRGEVRSGAYADSLRNHGLDGAPTYVAVYGVQHRGKFTVHIERAGYVPRAFSNVIVDGGECDLVATVLHVTMDPVPAVTSTP